VDIRNLAIKGIFFDAGDTLFEAQETIGETYSRLALQYGLRCDAAVLNGRFRAAFKVSPPMAFGKVSDKERLRLERQWWEQVVQSVFEGINFPEFEAFFQALYRYFGVGPAWRLFPETKAVVAALKSEGYTLGIISNFDSRLPAICKDLGLWDAFDLVLFSSREGFAKPSPEIFEAALERCGLSPSEAIHIGDHALNDVGGAERVGMTGILVDRSKRDAGGESSIPFGGHRITDLWGVADFLQNPSL